MLEYLLHQSVLSLVKLLVFATILFFLIQIIMPAGYVEQLSGPLPAAELRQALGFDLPLGQRYVHWINGLFRLDLGVSVTGQPVSEILEATIPPTLFVFLTGTAMALMAGLWLGTRTGWARPGRLSRLTALGGTALLTSFPPWLAWLVAYAFTRGRGFVVLADLGDLNGVSYRGLDPTLWAATGVQPAAVVVRMMLTLVASAVLFSIVNRAVQKLAGWRIPVAVLVLLTLAGAVASWYLLGVQLLAFDLVGASWLAIVAYALLSFGETVVIIQSTMASVRGAAYVTAARAKGLSDPHIRERHAARNALLPVLSRLVISLPYAITGVVIIESAVGWPGLGTSMWNALYWQNWPVIMGTVFVVGVLSLAARLILDAAMAYLDPRMRYSRQGPIVV